MTFALHPPMPPRASTGLNVHDLWRLLTDMDEEDGSTLAWALRAHVRKLRTSLPELTMVGLVCAYWEHLDRLCQAWILAQPTTEDEAVIQNIATCLARKITIRTWFLYADSLLGVNTSYLRGSRLAL